MLNIEPIPNKFHSVSNITTDKTKQLKSKAMPIVPVPSGAPIPEFSNLQLGTPDGRLHQS